MDLKSELLKSIWYAFTALDRGKSGKVSKSQLKVNTAAGLPPARSLTLPPPGHTQGQPRPPVSGSETRERRTTTYARPH